MKYESVIRMRMSRSAFREEDDFYSIKRRLAEAHEDNERVSFAGCCVTSSEWTDLVTLLPEDITSFTAQAVSISNKHIKSLVRRCRKITTLRLVDCMDLTERCIKSIGVNLRKLKSFHFEYKHGSFCPSSVDVLSILVKNSVSELEYVAFVGFTSITDVGVCYSVECFSYLQVINLSYCSQISDRGVIGVLDQCAYLKEIHLRGTQITDNSLRQIAHKAKRLVCVDFSHCCNITDAGIGELVDTVGNAIQELSVAGCIQFSDHTLINILYKCPSLKHLDFSNTSVTQVPPHILALRRLQVALFHNCKQLTQTPAAAMTQSQGGPPSSSWQDFLRSYATYNVPYRLRVFFLGETGSEKTALIHSLVKVTGNSHKHPSGADVYYWQPLAQSAAPEEEITKRSKKAEESHLMFEIYDLPEYKAGTAPSSVLFSSESLYVIVINSTQSQTDRTIHRYVTLIQSKAAGSRILVVRTCSNGTPVSDVMTTALDTERQNVKHIQKEKHFLRHLECDLKVSNRIDELGALMQLRPSISPAITVTLPVTARNDEENKDSKGDHISQFAESLMSEGLNYKNFRHLGRSLKVETIEVLSELHKLLENNILLVKWDELVEIVKKNQRLQVSLTVLKDIISLFHNVGYVVDLHFLDPISPQTNRHDSHYICINPPVFAHCLSLLHPEGSVARKTTVDIKKLWPKKKSRPDPGVLLAALEEITDKGLIRQSIVPIILQHLSLTEVQLMLLLEVLMRLGVLHTVDLGDSDLVLPGVVPGREENQGVVLPHYPGLSYHTCYRLPMCGVHYSVQPHIHWPMRPHLGDIQISWRYDFPCGRPLGLGQRLLSLCHLVARQVNASYIHPWTNGILCKLGEAFVCVEDYGQQVTVSGRVLADEPGQGRLVVQYLWAQLAPTLYTAEQYLLSWNGLFYKSNLQAIGPTLHRGVVIVQEPILPVRQCIELSQKQQEHIFTDDGMERYLDVPLLLPFDFSQFYDILGWLSHLVENRGTITGLLEEEEEEGGTPATEVVCEREHRKSVMSAGGNRHKKSVSFDGRCLKTSDKSESKQRNEVKQGPHIDRVQSSKSNLNSSKCKKSSTTTNNYKSVDDQSSVSQPSDILRLSKTDYRNLEGTCHWKKLQLLVTSQQVNLYEGSKSTQTECRGDAERVHKRAAVVVAEVIARSMLKHLIQETEQVKKVRNGSVLPSTEVKKEAHPSEPVHIIQHQKRRSREKSMKSRTCALL